MSQHANLLGAAWVGVHDLSHGIMAVSRVNAEAVALAAYARQAAGECTALAARLCIDNSTCSACLLNNTVAVLHWLLHAHVEARQYRGFSKTEMTEN